MTQMRRQIPLFPDIAAHPATRISKRSLRFQSDRLTGLRNGLLQREARHFFPECFVPRSNPQRAIHMLYKMCDYLDSAMLEPVWLQPLAVGGVNAWVFGLMGFRVSSELNVFTLLESHGESSLEIDAEFNLARPLESLKPYQILVETLYPALVPDDETYPYQPIDDALRDWLAQCAETLLKRDPAYQRLMKVDLPNALRLPQPIHQLCLQSRARPVGPELNSRHAQIAIAHSDALTSANLENPKLLPLLMAFIEAKNPTFDVDDLIRMLKMEILGRGRSEAAWRYVCRNGSRLFKVAWSLAPRQPAFEVALRYLAALEAAGLPPPPPPSVAAAWLRAFNVNQAYDSGIELGDDFHGKMNPTILRLAFAEADQRRSSPKLNDFIQEFLGVCWWSQQTGASIDKNQAHAGWSWLVNQWKAEQSVQEVLAQAKSITWPMQLTAISVGHWQVIPLSSSDALIRESFAMRNCLRDYIVRCAVGVEEYYSIRDSVTNKPKACFGIRFDDLGQGTLIDVKGFANSNSSTELRDLAYQLVSCMNLTAKPKFTKTRSGPPELQADEATEGELGHYTVMVDDNFHYMDESARRSLGSYDTFDSAIEACKGLVDQCLEEYIEPGISAERLLSQYKTFGDDPFIVCAEGGVKFSAWDYAEQRCKVITENGGRQK